MSNIIILGGLGFIARHLVKYLIDNNTYDNSINKIRVVDKCMLITCYMNKEHLKYYENNELVEYVQADLAREEHIKRILVKLKKKINEEDKKENGDLSPTWDYVINCCGETRYGLPDTEYKQEV